MRGRQKNVPYHVVQFEDPFVHTYVEFEFAVAGATDDGMVGRRVNYDRYTLVSEL